MAETTTLAITGSTIRLCRFIHCFVLLQLLFSVIVLISAESVIDSKSLGDVIVHEGNTARFLCYTSNILRSSIDSNVDDKFDGSQRVEVTWSFQGQPLEFELDDLDKPRVRTMSYEDRQVLEIGHARRDDAGQYACTVTAAAGQENTVEGTLSVQSVPDPPTEVEVKSCHGNAAEISWQPGSSNGAEITNFAIQFNISDKPDTWFDFYEDVPGEKTQAFVELSPYGTYSFRVLAKNVVGTSRPSNVTSRMCTTPPDRPGRNPALVWTQTDKKGYLVVKWEPLHRLSFHGPGFHYIVLWRLKGRLAWNSARVRDSHTTSYEQEVDHVYSTYEFQVKAANEMGVAHHPAFVYSGKSFEAEPEISVLNLRLDPEKPVTSNTVHLVWEAVDPSDSRIRGKFRGYKILYRRWFAGQDKDHKVSVLIPGHSIKSGQEVKATVSDLPAHSTIRFRVVVVNSHYQGPPSDVIDVFTPEGVPTAVGGLYADNVTPHSIILMWLPPEEPNGVLTGFDVGLQQVLGNKLSPGRMFHGHDPSQMRRRIDGLKANTRYRIYIVAKTKTGPGARSFIDVQTARRKPGKKKPWQNISKKPTGRTSSASVQESSYETDRMQPTDGNSACRSAVSTSHFIFIITSLLLRFLTDSASNGWS